MEALTEAILDEDVQALAGILDRLVPEEIAAEMVAFYKAEIPSYSRLPESVLEGRIFDATLSNVRLFNRLAKENREPTDAELEPSREAARADAREGISLEDLLQAYRMGGFVAWRKINDATLPEEYSAAAYGTEIFMRIAERMNHEVMRAYIDEQERLGAEDEPLYRRVFDTLVSGDEDEDEKLAKLAAKVRLTLGDSYVPIAAAACNGGGKQQHVVLRSALRSRGVLAMVEGERIAGIAAADFDKRLLDKPAVAFFVGAPVAREELAPALDEARLLVDVAADQGQAGEVRCSQFLLERLLYGSRDLAVHLEKDVLGPLMRDEEDAAGLVETLRAFVANSQARKATAKQLFIHPNTLDYRLRKIEELTGLDMHTADDLVKVTLALKSRDNRLAANGQPDA
jgi:hypothetical protein